MQDHSRNTEETVRQIASHEEKEAMNLLPKEQIKIDDCGDFVIAGVYEHEGYMHWVKYLKSELPNDFVSLDDIERFGIDIFYHADQHVAEKPLTKSARRRQRRLEIKAIRKRMGKMPWSYENKMNLIFCAISAAISITAIAIALVRLLR